MISASCKIAIRAVSYLCTLHHTKARAGLDEIAKEIEANKHTVGKILQRLSGKQVISSSKGRGGGFYLSSKQRSLPVLSVIQALGEAESLESCIVGTQPCHEDKLCAMHEQYAQLRETFRMWCTTNSINQLSEKNKNEELEWGYIYQDINS
ncbi:MAG: Rrf2 family transcriptional regulator [Candidatus Competibacteraceae bacterium]|nr:Rrf2 family transcriptional regulator [Candidatus Competibacteraceae bacterium]